MITKKGTVIKKSGAKTIKVQVNEKRAHPIYKKQYRVTKNFLVHDETEVANLNDVVTIKQCVPHSKMKRFSLDSVVSSAA